MRRHLALIAATLIGVCGTVVPAAAEAEPDPELVTTRLEAVAPCRLLDTRDDDVLPLPPGAEVLVQVRGRCDVPDDALAAAITLTSVLPQHDTAITAWPSGTPKPWTSNLNNAAGSVRANSTIVRLGDDGALAVATSGGGHLAIDVTAAFVPAEVSSAGRFVSMSPKRVADTRLGTRPDPGGTVRVALPDTIPADATAVAINVTVTGGHEPGFVTVHAAGTPRTWTSMLNTDSAGQTRAAMVIAPASADGVDVFTTAGDDVIVDITGWFTGESAEAGASGLFVPIDPFRRADTRAQGPRLYPDGTREWAVQQFFDRPASAVAANVTLVSADRPGWIAAQAARHHWNGTSSVNVTSRGETAANMALNPLSLAGMSLFTPSGGHAIIDLFGFFVGFPAAELTGAPLNEPPRPGHVLIVSDSTGAGMRWQPSALQFLTGFTYHLDLESCRRTIGTSCRGREGYTPTTAEVAIGLAPDDYYDTIVVMTGYNDWHTTFRNGIDRVMAAAAERGAYEVVWLTLRVDNEYNMPGNGQTAADSHRINNEHLAAALTRHPALRLADWNVHSADQDEWFASDGIHLTPEGARALARFLTDELVP